MISFIANSSAYNLINVAYVHLNENTAYLCEPRSVLDRTLPPLGRAAVLTASPHPRPSW